MRAPGRLSRGITRSGRNEVSVRAVYVGERARSCTACRRAKTDFEEGRHRFDRYRGRAERIFRRFGDHRSGGRDQRQRADACLNVTEESLELAIDKVRPGNRLFDVCGTVERHVVANGFSIVREFVGHGIGTSLHEEPQVPNYVDRQERESAAERRHGAGDRADGECRQAGHRRCWPDKWTAVTEDGSYSAHFEHSVAVTANGPWVLTRP